jgi:KDO2-lipid IV(A) lauroyltransferase
VLGDMWEVVRREGVTLALVYAAYVAGSRLALALPEPLAYACAHRLGAIVARLPSRRRRVVERNLQRVTGAEAGSRELRRIVLSAYRSYARYWLETFRLARESHAFFLERFTCHHVERLDSVRAAHGGAALVVIGHLGNWDAAGAWCGASGRPAATVAEVLRPRRLFDFFVRQRRRLGMTIYPAERGVTAHLVAEIEAGKLVALLGDRDLRGRGPEVKFFGAPAQFPLGPASVAVRTGLPILVAGVYSIRLPDGRYGWEADVSEPIEVTGERSAQALWELTQKVAWEMERFVARRPEEWHVFQPVWSADKQRGTGSAEPQQQRGTGSAEPQKQRGTGSTGPPQGGAGETMAR